MRRAIDSATDVPILNPIRCGISAEPAPRPERPVTGDLTARDLMAPELSPLRACPPAQAVSRERAPCEHKAVPGDHERLHSRRGVLELRFTAVRIECRIDQRTDASIRGIAVSPMDRHEHSTACDIATAVQPRDH